MEALRSGEAEIGGPLAKDRFWLWSEAGFHEIDRMVLGGQSERAVRPERPPQAERSVREQRLHRSDREPRRLRDGDLSLDPGEPVRLLSGEGLDPLRPGVDPDAVDPRLRPEITDEAVLGVQTTPTREQEITVRASWRRTRHLLEERFLVRDAATGEVFVATAGDWLPVGRLTGALPDGSPYDVPFWDLRPGLQWTGGTLLANGDRLQDDFGLSLNADTVLERELDLGTGRAAFPDELLSSRTLRLEVRMAWPARYW